MQIITAFSFIIRASLFQFLQLHCHAPIRHSNSSTARRMRPLGIGPSARAEIVSLRPPPAGGARRPAVGGEGTAARGCNAAAPVGGRRAAHPDGGALVVRWPPTPPHRPMGQRRRSFRRSLCCRARDSGPGADRDTTVACGRAMASPCPPARRCAPARGPAQPNRPEA